MDSRQSPLAVGASGDASGMGNEGLKAAPWSSEGVDFLRRVMAGEVYTGFSGQALARLAVGLDETARDRPYDGGDLARCMNVYWSAPASLRPEMEFIIRAWAVRLKHDAKGRIGWQYPGVPNFGTPRYYRCGDNLDEYWGLI